ncbi:hypothetical protein [Patulibacter sp.]|uniref:hypothetical protein n=1 Tax=Patulibacter sp. TaxID=1912859 RepID=UPI002723D5A5|nr:hypothetical protein [Patulibacter sp.]MDO9409356.1 hypothetical protein [Patulibacter sp.]
MADDLEQSTPVHLTFEEIEWLIVALADYKDDDPASDRHRLAVAVDRKLVAAQTGE